MTPAAARSDRPARATALVWALAVVGCVLAPLAASARPAPWPQLELPSLPAPLRQAGLADPAEAEQRATRALAATEDPGAQGLAYLARGLARYRLGRYRSAAADLGRSAERPTHNTDLARFFEAEAHFHAGDYVRAERLLRRFDRTFRDSWWRHRARMRLADALLGQGKTTEGVRALTRRLDTYPEFPHHASAWNALAEAERGRGNLDRAAGWLRRILRTYPGDPMSLTAQRDLGALEAQGAVAPTPEAQALYEAGTDLRQRKFFHSALAILQALLTDPRVDRTLRRRVRYQIGRTLFQMERFGEAVDTFDGLAAEVGQGRWRRQMLRWKSKALEGLGRYDEAAEALIHGSTVNTESPPPEVLERVAWLYFNGARYADAARVFGQLDRRGGEWRGKTRFMRVWLAYRLQDYETAAEGFKRLQAASSWRPARYGYWLARTLVHQGEIEAAVDTYRGIITSAPLSYYAYQARTRLDELGRPAEPEPLPEIDPDMVEALQTPPEIGEGCEDDDLACLTAHGGERPGDAPGVGAEAEAEVMTAVAPQSNRTQSNRTPDTEPATPGRPARRVPLVPQSALPPAHVLLSPLVEAGGRAMPGLPEAWELAAIGEHRFARQHLRAFADRLSAVRRGRPVKHRPYVDYRKDIDRAEWDRENDDKAMDLDGRTRRYLRRETRTTAFYVAMRDAFAALDDQHYARRYARREDRPTGLPQGADNVAWQRRYPRAFEQTVRDRAAHYGLDPYFIWALMTVESSYNPKAISRVGARGLMQVMPHTGGLVADRMTWRNWGPALLFEPEVAIEMAAWYFHQLLEKFRGQLPLAIASYNAGPHRVASWLTSKGHLPLDEFVEEIPYTEAREYTKKVLRYLALYRRIYEAAAPLRVGQIIDPRFRDNINF